MSSPIVVPEKFLNGPEGKTPLSAEAMNRIWDALMRALIDQLSPRSTNQDTSISNGEMILVDTRLGDVHLQVPPASTASSFGARKISPDDNQVHLIATGSDVLDENGSTRLVLSAQTDDVVLSYSVPGRYVVTRRSTVPKMATPERAGLVRFGPGGDLVGPADAVTVPGKENTGVAAALLNTHSLSQDPHGDREYARTYVVGQLDIHRNAGDPHGDRSWAQGNFVPLSWFDANGQLLPSRTPALAITSTSVVANQAAMLALNAQTGDIAIRTDAPSSGGGRTYILQGPDPTILANWTALPALGAVASVRGSAGNAMTGDVVIGYADVGAAPANDSRLTGAEQTSRRNQANGYVGLEANARINVGYLPGATVGSGGVIQLGGDLAGTWSAPTVPGKMPLMTPGLPVRTAAYTPILGEIAQYNAVNGSIASVLPAAPSGITVSILEVKNLTPATSTNTVSFTPAGNDTIDYRTDPIVLRHFAAVRRFVGFQGNWTVEPMMQLPSGGDTGQALLKRSAADNDTYWGTVATSGGSGGDVSGHTSASDPHQDRQFATNLLNSHTSASDPHQDRSWATGQFVPLTTARLMPAGGTTDQVLAKSSSSDYATKWVTPASGGGSSTVPLVPYPPIDQPFSTSVTPNAQTGGYRTMTATADWSLNAPSNPTDGQRLHLRWVASGAQRTMTFNVATGIRLPIVNGITMSNTLICPSGRRADVVLLYDAADGAWTVLSAQTQAA